MNLNFASTLFLSLALSAFTSLAADVELLPQEKPLIIAPPSTPEEGLKRLISGNKRYSEDKSSCPDRNQERRAALFSKQAPFAVILGCSDSRVSPEIAFDQGVGDLFVVRNAGNVISDVETDSIEYAVKVLKSSVILVLGHENCGAVSAVVDGQASSIPAVAALIAPAVQESKDLAGNPIENAIKMNVKRTVKYLRSSNKFSSLIQQNKLIVIGGYYNLHSGLVEIL